MSSETRVTVVAMTYLDCCSSPAAARFHSFVQLDLEYLEEWGC